MLAIPVGCPLLSESGQNVAMPRMSAKCQSQPMHRSKQHLCSITLLVKRTKKEDRLTGGL
jgi:hypothetical protein